MGTNDRGSTSNETGFSLLETVVAACIAAVLACFAIPKGQSLLAAAVLDHEAQMLASDLRFLQSISRTATYDRKSMNIPQEGKGPEMRINAAGYSIWGGNGVFLRKHEVPPDIRISPRNMSNVCFGVNGNPQASQMGSVFLYWKGNLAWKRRVVLDSVGRIRVDRK